MHQVDAAQGAFTLLFVNVFAEQMGVPMPSYPALLVAGSLASLTLGDAGYIALVWLIAMAACELADSIWYWAGRRYGRWSMAQICRISLEPDTCIRKNRNLYQRVGPKLLIVAKLVPGLGALSTLMAGATRTRYLTFLLYDSIGSALWITSGLVLGMVFRRAILATLAWLETCAAGRSSHPRRTVRLRYLENLAPPSLLEAEPFDPEVRRRGAQAHDSRGPGTTAGRCPRTDDGLGNHSRCDRDATGRAGSPCAAGHRCGYPDRGLLRLPE